MIENFTPWSALAGGALIGLSSLLVFALFGRPSGISGILGNALSGLMPGLDWRLGFLAGLIGAPLLYGVFNSAPIAFEINTTTWLLVLAGLLVGFGTRLGNGCTSGHGISGISRFSLRSILAVLTFMVVAIVLNIFI